MDLPLPDADESGSEDSSPQPSFKPVSFWTQQIAQALAARKVHEPWWQANLRAYAPDPSSSPESFRDEVNTNRDFVLVERKKADLFYQRPDVSLAPTSKTERPKPQIDPRTGQPAVNPQTGQPVMTSDLPALTAHEAIVNEALGPDGVDVIRVVHAALFDVLCTAGIGATVMGYESTTVDQPHPDPLMSALGMTVPVPIHERCFWQHVSPTRLLIPAEARSTSWDDLPWLGHQFTVPLTSATREKYGLDDDVVGTAPAPELQLGIGPSESSPTTITGTEIWYKSARYRDDVRHPQHLTHLVIIQGQSTAAIEEDCPYQTLDPMGRLTPDSLVGFPIHVLNVRILTDSAYPPSDCTIIRPLVNELNLFRGQMVQYRDAQTLRWSYNTDVLPTSALDKIVRAPIGGMIGLPSEAFVGEGAIKELPHGSMPRESFTSNDYIDNDISRTCGIDASGAGVQSTSTSTATEQQIIQANANARLDFERARVLQWYCDGVMKFSTLLQRYLSVDDAAGVVGPEIAQAWDGWRKTADSALAFTAMPDSALRVDQAVDRRQAQELYTYLAADPWIGAGRGKLLEKLLRKFHIDPTGIVNAPQPPKPAPPSLALSFKGEDLVAPQAPIVLEILKQLGVTVSPQAVTQSQGLLLQQEQLMAAAEAEKAAQSGDTTHGGKVPQMASLDKHQADAGLGMQGLGGVATGGGVSH